jgi:hypothetical protein
MKKKPGSQEFRFTVDGTEVIFRKAETTEDGELVGEIEVNDGGRLTEKEKRRVVKAAFDYWYHELVP